MTRIKCKNCTLTINKYIPFWKFSHFHCAREPADVTQYDIKARKFRIVCLVLAPQENREASRNTKSRHNNFALCVVCVLPTNPLLKRGLGSRRRREEWICLYRRGIACQRI